jgi:lipid-A-disaccharide synthase
VSGDALGADLIRALKCHYPDLQIEGVAGPQLIQEGCVALYPMDRLAVMGLVEPLKRLPELIRMRKQLKKHFLENPPDLFIGVDAPDFTLGLERALHQKGIKTVHYVSPSVWAWRQGRVKGIKQSVDLMLTLLPFEAEFYKQHQVPVCFVGHPLADQIPLDFEQKPGVNSKKKKITLLPGSRNTELQYMAPLYCQTARLCYEYCKEAGEALEFTVPLVSLSHKKYFESMQQEYAPEVPFTIQVGNVREAIAAADVVLVTSGTATLEVMLHKKPMVVAYKMHPITYQIVDRLVKVPYVALPNLLAQEFLVPEYIQHHATPKALGRMLIHYLNTPEESIRLAKRFTELHQVLKQGGSQAAAAAIIERFG